MPGGGSRHIVGSELGLADARGGGGGQTVSLTSNLRAWQLRVLRAAATAANCLVDFAL